MPHRLNTNLSTVPTIKELRGLIAASDAYDMDNVYFTEEGWVYRHYKKADQSEWWDEIISAGQVDVADSDNAPVISTVTAGVKLGTTAEASITFETGDGNKDFEYGDSGSGGGGTPPAPPVTLLTVTITGDGQVTGTTGETKSYVPGMTGTASDVTYVLVSNVGDDTISGYDVTFGATTGARVLKFTGTSLAASTSVDSTGLTITTSNPTPTADVTLTLTGAAAGNTAYTTDSGNNAAITATIGQIIDIVNNSGGHPVDVVVADGGAQVTSGTLTGAPASNGQTVRWDTTGVTAGTYYYQCSSHAAMIGTITIS